MVKIQIELSEEEDYIVENYKAQERLKDKKEAVRKLIKEMNKIRKITKTKGK